MPSLNDLSLRQLQYLVAVADTLGFHKAAARCHVSQPALSAQVQQLELVLGVNVFERDRRHVLVTSDGAEIVARARRVLLEGEDLVAAAVRLRDPFTGTLRIGVIPTIAPYLLPEIVPTLGRAYPRLSLVFREEKTSDIVRDLGLGVLDGALLALEAELGECAHAELGKDAFVVALPQGHPLAKKKRLSPDDLREHRLLLLDEGHCLRDQVLQLCTGMRAVSESLRATSLVTLTQMVASGAGITLLPTLAVPVENRRGQLQIRPFTRPVPGRTLALAWRPRSPLGDVFTELARSLRRDVPR